MTPRHTHPMQSGFTLLELIVVLLIFSIMSILAYGGLRSVLDTRVGVEAARDRTAEFQRSYRRVRDDIRQLSAEAGAGPEACVVSLATGDAGVGA